MGYSPVLSMLTAAFEVIVAVWALSGPGRKPIIRTMTAILFLLAGYQILETLICVSPSTSDVLPRLAFINVSWLPPTGLLLIAQFRAGQSRVTYRYAQLMFLLALGFSAWIAFDRGFATDPVCRVVLAQYSHPAMPYLAYGTFYWLGLAGMVFLSAYGAAVSGASDQRRSLLYILGGTLGFIIPSLLTAWLAPPDGAFASLMCHYALVFAITLTRLIYLERRKAYTVPGAITQHN